jgi:hypothetical protein
MANMDDTLTGFVPPLSWREIDADERRKDNRVAAAVTTDEDDITDIAPLAPRFLRYSDEVGHDDPGREQRRAKLMAREPGWPDNAAPSGRVLGLMSLLVVVAVVALIGMTFSV